MLRPIDNRWAASTIVSMTGWASSICVVWLMGVSFGWGVLGHLLRTGTSGDGARG